MRGRTPHLLIVEDDAVEAMAIERALDREGVTLPRHLARDGDEALAMLRGGEGRPPLPTHCLIILDINMPRVSGHAFLDALRADPALRRHAVIVYTTSDADRDRFAAWERNVAAYLLKSVDDVELVGLTRLITVYSEHVALP